MPPQQDNIFTDRTAHRQAHVAQMRSTIAAHGLHALSAAEQADLLLMREEEKIARDVYLRLYDRWGLRPFANISGSEQAHMDMILLLLDRHGMTDPVRGLDVGVFHDPQMQTLHDDLLARGLKSETDAILVGLLIEELDIADLRAATRRTEQPEIQAVYAELERGSRNHLRAFYRWMENFGAQYTPAHLSAEDFLAVAHSGHESCG
jgi:hypothetical protein